MKKIAIIAACLASGALASQALAGNLSCQARPAAPGGEPLVLKILWGQGIHGADVTLVSSSTGSLTFPSGYLPETSGGNVVAYHSPLLAPGSGQHFGDVTVFENQNVAVSNLPVTGKFVMTTKEGTKSYDLTCLDSGPVEPNPKPTPCRGRACF